jgi:hypothetical protein
MEVGLMEYRVTYWDLVERRTISKCDIEKQNLKLIKKWGILHSETKNFIRLIVEEDCDDKTENDVMIIPKACIVKMEEIK